MYCPFCRHPDSRVIDSRTAEDGTAIRRRRSCPECGRRFTTQESVILMVAKRSGVTEPFTRDKIVRGVQRACQGRPVDVDQLAMLAQRVEETIRAREEEKIRVLRDAGFDMDLGGADIVSVQYQNANNSVRVSDEFMGAVAEGKPFDLLARRTGEVIETVDAKQLFRKMAQAAWECADPGIQYDGMINDWHTCPESGRITASNPCSEYVHLDNSSCNLASINLLKFLRQDDTFDAERFAKMSELIITAMDISICFADFPTTKIGETTRAFRQLGIGYANLGALLMATGHVPRALKNLGYQAEQIEAITEYIAEHGHVVNAPGLRQEHYEVFDCAMGERSISPMGHVRMMAAVQPMLSGSISKTVNMPESATVEDVEQIYFEGWQLGLKALAIYRDNCKVGQPLSVAKKKEEPAQAQAAIPAPAQTLPQPPEPHEHRPVRKRLPKRRSATVTKFDVAGAEGYMTASRYPDDGVGEVFLKLGKQGSTLAGVMDAFSISISVGLQYGIPLDSYVAKFTNMRFEPAGMTDDPDVRIASSVMDYIFRRLALDHLPYEQRAELGILSAAERAAQLSGQDPATLGEDPDPLELAQSAAVETAYSPERAVPSPQAHPASPESQTPDAPGTPVRGAAAPASRPASAPNGGPHSTAELIEAQQGRTADAPLCLTCGTKMRPAGSCYVCEGCGSTSGCS